MNIIAFQGASMLSRRGERFLAAFKVGWVQVSHH